MAYFHSMPFLAEATVAVLSKSAPEYCFVSFAGRAYDTTDFVERHPGGSELMQEHHGQDATPIFNAFPHTH